MLAHMPTTLLNKNANVCIKGGGSALIFVRTQF